MEGILEFRGRIKVNKSRLKIRETREVESRSFEAELERVLTLCKSCCRHGEIEVHQSEPSA